jgi:hypothetical protein
MKKVMLALALLTMSACTKPTLPEPRVQIDLPPAELLKPAEKLKTIPVKETPSENQ